MANRLLPFRQYDENDVVNLYAVDETAVTAGNSTDADAGVLVKVHAADLDSAAVSYNHSHSHFASFSNAHVGKNGYPEVAWKAKATTAETDTVLGITLKQTVDTDENGEKLLFYPQKKDELQAVLPGEAVPVATRGVFMVSAAAMDESTAGFTAPAAGTALCASPNGNGKFAPATGANSSETVIGTLLGKGSRKSTDLHGGNTYLIKLG